jgi:hypothetical protein
MKRTGDVLAMTAAGSSQVRSKDVLEEAVSRVTAEALSLRGKIIAWRRDFNTALIDALDLKNSQKSAENDTDNRYELLGICLVMHMLVDRMLVCLSPPRDGQGMLLEDEVLALTAELRQFRNSSLATESRERALFNLKQKARVTDAVFITHKAFHAAMHRSEGRTVNPALLKRFCVALGRRC